MEPDTTKIWTRAEVRVTVGKLIVESLGVDEATVTDDAALVADLGAESLDFLDMSFKCQQTFGVDLPVRLIQDPRIEWRAPPGLARGIEGREGAARPAPDAGPGGPPAVAPRPRSFPRTNGGPPPTGAAGRG